MKKLLLLGLLVFTSLTYAQPPSITTPDDIIQFEFPFDGFAVFDLTINETVILTGIDPATVSVLYYTTLTDAQNQSNAIANATNWSNSANPETIYVNVTDLSTNLFSITSFELIVEEDVVNIPDDNFLGALISLGADTNSSGNIQFSEAQLFSMPLMDVSNSGISSLEGIEAFVNVNNLNCSNNQLTNLDLTSNTNLNFLNCNNNNLNSINVSNNSNLTDLLALNNNITTLSLLNHPSLEVLWLGNNNLNSLNLDGCPALEELALSNNSLTTLNLSNNVALKDLQCSQNQISTLDISNNPILNLLQIWGNPLNNLDLSNNFLLEELGVSNSNLTTLDLSANTNLLYLSIASNPLLETVFIKNGSDESTNIDGGSWLENWILGNNPSLQYVCADDFQVAQIQQFAGTDYVVNSFCNFQPGGDFNTITGNVQFDLDDDGCDTSDPIIPYLVMAAGLDSEPLTSAVTSDSAGVYTLYVGQTGTYTVAPNLENPSYFNFTPNPAMVDIPFVDNTTTTQDFCLTANGVVADVEVVIAPIFPSRPGFDATYKLVYKNKGNQVLSGSVNFEYDDAVLDFISATTTPDAENTGELSFNFTDLQAFESRFIDITLNVNDPMETPAINIDDVLDYSSSISIDQTEFTPVDNTFDYSEIVVGAYDPNDITCLQGDVVPDTFIGEFLHYMIRFENTGNAAAETVIVTTAINPGDYDINTLQILNASHDMFLRNNNGVIEFVFENIFLAGGGGHGNILLKIKTIPSLNPTDQVEAQADIYFDFNFPIITNIANTTFDTLSVNDFSTEIELSMYPNPTTSHIFIETDTTMQSITLYDIKGRIVLNVDIKANQTRVDLTPYSNGIYFIKIDTNEGQVTKKIIKK